MNQGITFKKDRIEELKYESYLNALEQAFIRHKTGVRQIDQAMLKFADEIIAKFAAIYANTRDEKLGEQLLEIIITVKQNLN